MWITALTAPPSYAFNLCLQSSAGGPRSDVWCRAIFRNRRPVMSIAPGQVPLATTDATRLPYWTEIPLDSLAAGQYILLVSATDRIGNRKASQRSSSRWNDASRFAQTHFELFRAASCDSGIGSRFRKRTIHEITLKLTNEHETNWS